MFANVNTKENENENRTKRTRTERERENEREHENGVSVWQKTLPPSQRHNQHHFPLTISLAISLANSLPKPSLPLPTVLCAIDKHIIGVGVGEQEDGPDLQAAQNTNISKFSILTTSCTHTNDQTYVHTASALPYLYAHESNP